MYGEETFGTDLGEGVGSVEDLPYTLTHRKGEDTPTVLVPMVGARFVQGVEKKDLGVHGMLLQ